MGNVFLVEIRSDVYAKQDSQDTNVKEKSTIVILGKDCLLPTAQIRPKYCDNTLLLKQVNKQIIYKKRKNIFFTFQIYYDTLI